MKRLTVVVTLSFLVGAAHGGTLDPAAYSSLGTFDPTGNVVINTTTDTITQSGTTLFTGVSNNGVAIFDFSSITINSGISLNVTGSQALGLLSLGNATVAGTLTLDGTSATSGSGAAGNGGGGAGGTSSGLTNAGGLGPGGGNGGGFVADTTAFAGGGGGAGFGGVGGLGSPESGGGAGGGIYGNLFNALQGGSGGGPGSASTSNDSSCCQNGVGGGGGGGAGAVGIIGLGTLTFSGSIQANGGTGGGGGSTGAGGGGGGSGGGILLGGTVVSLSGSLQASGGAGGTATLNSVDQTNKFHPGGGGGGGGLIAVQTPSYIVSNSSPLSLSVGGGAAGTGAAGGSQGAIAYSGVIIPVGQFFQLVNGLSSDASGLITVQSGTGGGGILNTMGGYTNTAQIELGGSNAHVTGDALTNTGQIGGTGYIDATLINGVGGQLNLGSTDQMVLTGAGGSNSGGINITGGNLQIDQAFTNNQGGTITGTNATMFLNGGLNNSGNLELSTGNNNIYGGIDNLSSGNIVVSGGGNATFWGNVVNDGNIVVQNSGNSDSTATFFGTLSGSNGITGGGTVYIAGVLSPGDDPAAVSFGGDLELESSGQFDVELGGTATGSYDSVSVAETLGLSGILDVTFFDGFDPVAGDSFDILNWSSISGTFSAIDLPALDPGLSWNTSDLYTDGVISVQSPTPEPGTFLLSAGALGGALMWLFRQLFRQQQGVA